MNSTSCSTEPAKQLSKCMSLAKPHSATERWKLLNTQMSVNPSSISLNGREAQLEIKKDGESTNSRMDQTKSSPFSKWLCQRQKSRLLMMDLNQETPTMLVSAAKTRRTAISPRLPQPWVLPSQANTTNSLTNNSSNEDEQY